MKDKNDFLLWGIAGSFLVAGVLIIGWGVLHYKRPPKALSINELSEKNREDLTEIFPSHVAALVGGLYVSSDMRMRQQAKLEGTEFIQQMTDENGNPIPQSTKTQLLNRFYSILREIDARRADNSEQAGSLYNQEENDRWRKKLPLHKSNLTFKGPNGEKPLSHEEIACPHTIEDIRAKESICYEYRYADNVKSIFFFDDDMLRERDDIKNGHALARYSFPPPPFYTEKDNPSYEGVTNGSVFLANRYDTKYTLPIEELYYSFNGMLATVTLRDFEKNILEAKGYFSDGLFYSYERSTLQSNTEGNSLRNIKSLRIEKYFSPDLPPDTDWYIMEMINDGERRLVKGKWTETPTREVVLDNGMHFPPVTEFPYAQAPRYCTIYPKGCKHK